MSKLGKVIVLRVPEGVDPVVELSNLINACVLNAKRAPADRCNYDSARLLDLDAMDDGASGMSDHEYGGYNAALKDIAGDA